MTHQIQTNSDPFRRANRISLVLVGISILVLPLVWAMLPDGQWPIHWDLQGNVNGYGGRGMAVAALSIMALTMLSLHALFWWLPRLEGLRDSLRQSTRAYAAVWIATMGFLLVMHVATVWLMWHLASRSGATMPLDLTDNFLRWVCVAVGGLFAVIGNLFGKIRHNAVFGIRTPFTLTSRRAWERTHRVGGPLFVVTGVLMIVVALVKPTAAIVTITVLPLVLVLGLTVYSYRIWKTDPDRMG